MSKVKSTRKLHQEDIAKAREQGALPHEILLSIARGEPQQYVKVDPVSFTRSFAYVEVSDIALRAQCARDAAPYYAPKLSSIEVLRSLKDDDLDSLIESLAAEAGVSLTASGEGEEGRDEEEAAAGAGSSPGRVRRRINVPE